jgi:allophanate hydrolase subunit 2
VLAVVRTADLAAVAQLRPGDRLRFTAAPPAGGRRQRAAARTSE